MHVEINWKLSLPLLLPLVVELSDKKKEKQHNKNESRKPLFASFAFSLLFLIDFISFVYAVQGQVQR